MHLWFWKHNKQELPVIISHEDYEKLPAKHKKHFEKAGKGAKPTYGHKRDDGSDDDFGLQALAGVIGDDYIPDNPYIAGSDLSGPSGDAQATGQDFGGGSGGGAGASDSYAGDSSAADSTSSDSGSSGGDSSGGDVGGGGGGD